MINTGKKEIIRQLKEQADEEREWLMEHTSPDVPANLFEVHARAYNIIRTKIATIDKCW